MYVIKWMQLYPQGEVKVWEDDEGRVMAFRSYDSALEKCGELLSRPEYVSMGLSFWVDFDHSLNEKEEFQ